ncbi:hypothetical protein ACKWWA_002687 [Enterobacter bugandensis]
MLSNVKKKIIDNDFVNNVRIHMVFNDEQYNDLVSSLEELANLLKNNEPIDKELALYLYTIPQMIRNELSARCPSGSHFCPEKVCNITHQKNPFGSCLFRAVVKPHFANPLPPDQAGSTKAA